MTYQNLVVEIRSPAAIVTLSREEALNALNRQTLVELGEVFVDLSVRPDVRAIILTGAGRAFVAGADISEMAQMTPLEAEEFSAFGQDLLSMMEALPVPIIAAVNGYALGGGCELAMACDIVLCGAKARFGQPESSLGLIPGFGATQRLSRLIGPMRARELIYTGRTIHAPEAVALGLALRVVPDEEGGVVAAAEALVGHIASRGPVAVRLAKRAINENFDADLGVGLAAERSLFAMCFSTDDQAEGCSAFVEKRPPQFTGR
jgi:enoyl-CoA hydratase